MFTVQYKSGSRFLFDFSGGCGENSCTAYKKMTYEYISDCKRQEKTKKQIQNFLIKNIAKH